MLQTLIPFSIVYLPVSPLINSLTMSFTLFELPIVRIVIWVPFETPTVSQIQIPVSFILAPVFISHDTKTMPQQLRLLLC